MAQGRIARGWALTTKSWSVIRSHPALIGFTVITMVSAIIVTAAFAVLAAWLFHETHLAWVAIPVVLVAFFVLVTIATFFSVALAVAADKALAGQQPSLGEGMAAAGGRFGDILAWSSVRFVLGAVLTLLEALLKDAAGQVVSSIIGALADLAWRVATFFVIPVIAFEGGSPKKAISSSVKLVKEKWGEGLTGTTAISAITGLAGVLPAFVIIAIGVLVGEDGDTVSVLGITLIVVGAVWLAIALLIQSTLMSVFRVALFRFATDGQARAPYTHDELANAFTAKVRR